MRSEEKSSSTQLNRAWALAGQSSCLHQLFLHQITTAGTGVQLFALPIHNIKSPILSCFCLLCPALSVFNYAIRSPTATVSENELILLPSQIGSEVCLSLRKGRCGAWSFVCSESKQQGVSTWLAVSLGAEGRRELLPHPHPSVLVLPLHSALPQHARGTGPLLGGTQRDTKLAHWDRMEVRPQNCLFLKGLLTTHHKIWIFRNPSMLPCYPNELFKGFFLQYRSIGLHSDEDTKSPVISTGTEESNTFWNLSRTCLK